MQVQEGSLVLTSANVLAKKPWTQANTSGNETLNDLETKDTGS